MGPAEGGGAGAELGVHVLEAIEPRGEPLAAEACAAVLLQERGELDDHAAPGSPYGHCSVTVSGLPGVAKRISLGTVHEAPSPATSLNWRSPSLTWTVTGMAPMS